MDPSTEEIVAVKLMRETLMEMREECRDIGGTQMLKAMSSMTMAFVNLGVFLAIHGHARLVPPPTPSDSDIPL